ncbi:MAG: hypothetical protein AVDCRST_MAG19-3800 [uncultured Thermomicrobiales bacterium]|uniref:Uncharacterized protein n=1 Tax=uncultured Thermomicrobiales bacterium TaxID=1645740 RepID=A0A6J4VJA0_9BACT|nr:MAG: hypothetical protein AVDCRST_MAG19-3800 [uncultured Thermomicrobiales bacterium]
MRCPVPRADANATAPRCAANAGSVNERITFPGILSSSVSLGTTIMYSV